MKSRTIVFIHGMYMTPLCLEKWTGYFKAQGYEWLAPAWPAHEGPVEVLRKNHPDPNLGKLTLSDVLKHFTRVIQSLPEKPILIGHSMGGLVAQLLLQCDLAEAAVAIDSAPPQGVFTTQWPFLKSNWPHINPFAPQSQPIQMTFPRVQYTFVNSLPLEEQQAAFDRYVVPESRKVPAESLTSTAYIDFKREHQPLLLIAGSADHLIPAALNKRNYARYRNTDSITDFKEFTGRTHFITGQRGWEEVAEHVAAWLKDKGV